MAHSQQNPGTPDLNKHLKAMRVQPSVSWQKSALNALLREAGGKNVTESAPERIHLRTNTFLTFFPVSLVKKYIILPSSVLAVLVVAIIGIRGFANGATPSNFNLDILDINHAGLWMYAKTILQKISQRNHSSIGQ